MSASAQINVSGGRCRTIDGPLDQILAAPSFRHSSLAICRRISKRAWSNGCTSRPVVSSQSVDVMERISNRTRTHGRRDMEAGSSRVGASSNLDSHMSRPGHVALGRWLSRTLYPGP
jgi:hypothetical protein